jgi:hypothetical protein
MKRFAVMIALLFASLVLLPAVGSAHAATAHTAKHDMVRLVDASPAGIQDTCWGGWLCGHIYNDDNARVLHITNHWPGRENPDYWRFLNPGQSYGGRDATEDADGFFVPDGCTATVAFVQRLGPGWHRVSNGQHIHVTDISC